MIRASGGAVKVGATVTAIQEGSEGGIWIECDGNRDHFDKVICTGPVDVLRRLTGGRLAQVEPSAKEVEYLGVVCLVLITRRPITPFYVLNIADSRIPFTGVIGMSTVVSTDETADLFITYFPKYVLSDDALLRQRDDVIRREFIKGVTLLYPGLQEGDIVSSHVHRAVKVQPLQVLRYSDLVPSVRTGHDDFFVLNTSQFVNSTLNNNEVIRAVDEFLEAHGTRLEQSRDGLAPLTVATT
jgi:protoporphyrinogen oxidase